MPKVYNRHNGDAPKDAVYIGRGTPYGNPFSHHDFPNTQLVSSREAAVDQYWEYVEAHPELKEIIRATLRGKDLVCSCAPKPCHGDVLIRIANDLEDEDG